jgi:tetrapyrrole methylase family protein/MazG family protein
LGQIAGFEKNMENAKLAGDGSAFEGLIRLIETLRGENGCPWDKKQVPQSMVVYLVEEIYELVEAIESGHEAAVYEELGDVLFHIFFLARMYAEKGMFSIQDVARGCTQKMIRRHPHVFGGAKVDSSDQVTQNWHKMKQAEKGESDSASTLDSVPLCLPALMRAYRVSERAARSGFDWDKPAGVLEKMVEEISELERAMAESRPDETATEFGDVLFTFVNLARFARIHPETALRLSTRKFEQRFKRMERRILDSGKTLESVSQEEKDRIWEELKASET